MIETQEKPLVSFVMLAYNQENLVREAIEGAFSQTYSPLEIIFSDDCSKDRTYEIMEQMVATYKGPHKIILNRNKTNLGIIGNFNRVSELVKGDLIITAAGDDISLPNRSEEMVRKWLSDRQNIHSIYCAYQKILDNKTVIGEQLEPTLSADFDKEFLFDNSSPLGAVCAYSSNCLRTFGPLIEGHPYEDKILAFRAALLGKIVYLPKVLVQYRVQHASSRRKCRSMTLKTLSYFESALKDNLEDNRWLCTLSQNVIKQKRLDLARINAPKEYSSKLDLQEQENKFLNTIATEGPLLPKFRILRQIRFNRMYAIKLLTKSMLLNLVKN